MRGKEERRIKEKKDGRVKEKERKRERKRRVKKREARAQFYDFFPRRSAAFMVTTKIIMI